MRTLLLALIVSCLSSVVSGQEGLKSIENTAKEKTSARDFNTTRSNRERGNLMDEKSKQSSPAPASAPAPGAAQPESAEPAPTEPSCEYQASYTFTGSISYAVESSQRPGEINPISYDFGNNVMGITMKPGMQIILDSKNAVMILLNNNEKTAKIIGDKVTEQQQTEPEQKLEAKVTKTGRTKTIIGYRCEEVLIESGGKKTEIWVTRDAGMDVSNTFIKANKANVSKIPVEAFKEGGMPMETIAHDPSGKIEMHMVVTALSKEAKTVNIGAYKITKL